MRLLPLLAALLLIGAAAQAADTAPPGGVTPTHCGPGDSGAPCDGSGPASQGNSSGTNQGAGNPINVITGNKYQQEIDLPALPGVLGLEIVRHYNSSLSGPSTPPGITGRGWRLSYETDLYPVANTLQIVQADGTRIIFIRDLNNPSACASNNPAHGRLAITRTPRGEEYVWTWVNGRTLSFNHQGKLTQIKAPTGEFVSLTRDPAGLLVKITDPQGRSLVLGYPQRRSPDRYNGVTHIDSPVGRFGYTYGSAVPTGHASGSAPKGVPANPRDRIANLVRVDLPGSIRRHYHHEDPARPTLLTGISVAGQGTKPQRIATWAYDSQGRGILSVKGASRRIGQDGQPVPGTGIEQVSLDFAALGRTILTNSLGQTTTFIHAIVGGEYRLLEVRGAGCASCGETNMKYGYDKLGRLTEATKLSPTGQPLATTRTDRDLLGRPTRVSRVVYQNGKPQPARLIARYEYAGNTDRPVLIARSSVVQGREHQIRIAYNTHGQAAQVTESGFSPLDATGQPAATPEHATPIVRTTTYGYTTVNGRSLLSQIDGPLPNGPKSDPSDSDVTRIEWEPSGSRVVTLTQPGKGADTVAYDKAGRIARVRNAEGFATSFQYNSRNQLLSMVSAGDTWAQHDIKPVVESYRYDALGNRIETGSGGAGSDPYRPHTRQAFDVAGRLLWQAEALGILKRARYDSEGKLLASTVQTRSFEQAERYRYDAQNRLSQVADNTGSVRNLVDGERSRAGQGRVSAFRVLKDDFGREVRLASASHGTVIRHHDAADRLVEQRDDTGHAHRYVYDLTGRRVRHASVSGSGSKQITTWRYASGRLVEISGPVQTERIRYNARGLPESKTVSLKLANGAEAIHVTRYTYDADGSLIGESLPDGSKIRYERNGQGQVVAVHRQTSPWTFFGWGQTTLVKDLQRDLVGLRSITYGNGIQGQWQRSREGVLARVVYTRPSGRGADSSHMAAASQAAVGQSTLGSILDHLLPAAHAQSPANAPSQLPGALGLPASPHALFDARLLYDNAGNVLLQQQHGHGPQLTQAYAYDRQSQLIAAQSATPAATVKASTAASAASVWRYHYDAHGNRVLAQENVPVTQHGRTRKAAYDPASGAMTSPQSERAYVWDGQGRLTMIRQQSQILAQYAYNHRSLRVGKQTASGATHTLYNDQRQRIADLDAEGRITRQYLWLADQLIATLDARQPKALQAPAEGFVAELAQALASLWASLTGNADRLVFVHVNHLGTPIAATDEAGPAIWQAAYAPYGQVIRTRAAGNTSYTLALRLPGQWEDEESGLYYNDFRYYDPQAGRYLSPDPLGRLAERLDSPNAYAYVNNNPLSYIDPWGLILFAFDGTGNDESHQDTLSNVVNFRNLYNDGNFQYVTGVGTEHIDTEYGNIKHWAGNTIDSGANYTGPARIARMVQYFNDEADAFDDNAVMNVDIIGFSRGAAQARDFANRIVANTKNGWYSYKDKSGTDKCQKVNFRFMGLFDTVLSTNLSSYSYNLGIPDEFSYVAQAVALNEYRGKTLRSLPGSVGAFPLESILDGMYGLVPITGQTRIERGFLGSHSDIGGGFEQGDLSRVALSWMVDQSRSAGVSMHDAPTTIIANPVLHDKSDNQYSPTGAPGADGEDRQVRYRDGSTTTQRAMIGPSGMNWSDTGQFTSYLPRTVDENGDVIPRADFVTGTVDAQAYINWLNANGYNINVAVQ